MAVSCRGHSKEGALIGTQRVTQSGYSTADAARILELSAARIRALARSGLVAPRRGARGEYRFAFADLIILRTARGLLEAGVPFARVRRALHNLADRLPEGRPITAVRIVADGARVIVQDADVLWDAESSQTLLNFKVADLAEQIAPLARNAATAGLAPNQTLGPSDWFEIGCDLELCSTDEAAQAYRQALAIDPEHADSLVNLGRLLHELGDVDSAEQHYRRALSVRPTDLTALFNLAVALEDTGRLREATLSYRETLLADPDHADAHFNLAAVLDRTDQRLAAIKHHEAYQRLVSGRIARDLAGDDRAP